MADIFISYKREDEEEYGRVKPIAQALEAEGYDVFYDVEIPPGSTWETVLQSKIDAAKCVLVLWSSSSVASDWVKEEAEIAKENGKIIPVFLEAVRAPFGFTRIEGANLADWDGDLSHHEWKNLLAVLKARIDAPTHAARADVRRVAMPPKPKQKSEKSGGGLGWLMALVLIGAIGGGGYWGYQNFSDKLFGAKPRPGTIIDSDEAASANADQDPEPEPTATPTPSPTRTLPVPRPTLTAVTPPVRDIRPTPLATIDGSRLQAALRPKGEDCIKYTGRPTLKDVNGRVQILSGRSVIQTVSKRAEAEQILRTIANYKLDSQCFVARPNPPVSYWLSNGKMPTGSMAGEDCLSVNIDNLSARVRGGMHLLMNGRSSMASFQKEDDVKQAIAILKHYKVRQICYVGRPGPSMTYLKR